MLPKKPASFFGWSSRITPPEGVATIGQEVGRFVGVVAVEVGINVVPGEGGIVGVAVGGAGVETGQQAPDVTLKLKFPPSGPSVVKRYELVGERNP